MPQSAVQGRCLRKVGEEMPGFTPTFGGGMPQSAVQGRCLRKVVEEMPGFALTFGHGMLQGAVVGSEVAWLMTLEKVHTGKGQIALTRCWSRGDTAGSLTAGKLRQRLDPGNHLIYDRR